MFVVRPAVRIWGFHRWLVAVVTEAQCGMGRRRNDRLMVHGSIQQLAYRRLQIIARKSSEQDE
jgi:hypothetical protein